MSVKNGGGSYAFSQEIRRVVENKSVTLPCGCIHLKGREARDTGRHIPPYILLRGVRVNLRRECYGWVKGRKPLGNRRVECTCGDSCCFNPEHLLRGDRDRGGSNGQAGEKKRRYNWDGLFSRASFELRQGRDFMGSLSGMG